MALWPLQDASLQIVAGQITSTSLWTTVTSSATANAAGNYVQMYAATPWQVYEIWLFLAQTGLAASAVNVQGLIDIGIGPAGSEALLVPNFGAGSVGPFAAWRFPVTVDEGRRLAVRLRTATASRSCTMGMALVGGGSGMEAGSSVATYGAVTASSIGTVLAAPGAANTESAWTAITASTTAPIRWLMLGLCAPNTATATATEGLLDVGIGASGSEQAIITDVPFQVTAAEQINFPCSLTFPADVPVGTRIAVRYRATSTSTLSSPSVTLTGIG